MICKPETMSYKDKNIIIILSGLPGTGKTTLSLSAPKVLLIDADEGLCRVRPEHRKDASICNNYEEILADIKAAEGVYDTIVIDTAGALIEYLKDWAVRTDPKASKTNGGISLQGFGVVKQEFLRLSAELKKKFNVVYLFHETAALSADQKVYDEAIKLGTEIVNSVNTPDDVETALVAIKQLKHQLTSEKELTAALKKRLQELGITYNKSSKKYEYAKKD